MPSPINKQPSIEIPWHDLLGDNLLGFDSAQLSLLTSSLFNHSPRSIRVSPRCEPGKLPFTLQPVPWHDRGYWLADATIRPGAFLHYAAGQYYIQDSASLLAVSLCDLQPGQKVCDLCAAPGGKASAILDKLAGTGFLLANEVIQSRIPLLQTALCRSGWDNFATSQLDAEQLSQALPGQFDCVLVDAPCSGQSMVGRDKQSLMAFSLDQVEHSALRQRRIIRAAAKLVSAGGRLVYSTCTFSVAENEAIIEYFLEEQPDWRLVELPQFQTWSSARLRGCYRLWPHLHSCDGAFAAVLQRNSEPPTDVDCLAPPTKQSSRTQVQRALIDLRQFEFLKCDFSPSPSDAIGNDDLSSNGTLESYQLWQFGDQLHLLKKASVMGLSSAISGAVPIAQLFASRVEPLYGSAVVKLQGLNPTRSIELDDSQAMAFVRGESVSSPKVSMQPGWCQVLWNGWPLAWGKLAGNSLKNHLPKLLRNPSMGAV